MLVQSQAAKQAEAAAAKEEDNESDSDDDPEPSADDEVARSKWATRRAAAMAARANKSGAWQLDGNLGMRHIVTLKPGAMVGEIALLDGSKRCAPDLASPPPLPPQPG